MRIIRGFSPADHTPPLAMVVGNFDGMHIGHRQLIGLAVASGGTPAAMTFEPHPLSVVRPQIPLYRIVGRRQKFALLKAQGIKLLYMPIFNRSLAALSAEVFAALLFERLAVRRLIVGENFRFGHAARGDCDLLRSVAAKHGAELVASPLCDLDGEAVSSGRIRRVLREGDFVMAERLLGEKWRLVGRVCHGEQRGRVWGVPTANLHLPFVPPCCGIFAASVQIGDARYRAAVSIGVNPTVSSSTAVRVEAHLLDFSGDVYGRQMVVTPLCKIRDERQFPTVEELRIAIADDIAQVRHYFGE